MRANERSCSAGHNKAGENPTEYPERNSKRLLSKKNSRSRSVSLPPANGTKDCTACFILSFCTIFSLTNQPPAGQQLVKHPLFLSQSVLNFRIKKNRWLAIVGKYEVHDITSFFLFFSSPVLCPCLVLVANPTRLAVSDNCTFVKPYRSFANPQDRLGVV